MSIREFTVKSLAEYFECIRDLSKENNILWYRGHADEKYLLQPAIFRAPFNWEKEKSFMNEFKAKAVKFIKPADDYFEWLFIMQHHGTPTRLLDWSESAIVALSFATQYRNKEQEECNAVVWCLNPVIFNEKVRFGSYEDEPIPNICENRDLAEMYKDNTRVKRPVAILGSYNNERIIAQKGVFTLFPAQDSFSIEDLDDSETYLTKIVIKKEDVKQMSDELYFVGCNELSLFPELSSISKEILRKNT